MELKPQWSEFFYAFTLSGDNGERKFKGKVTKTSAAAKISDLEAITKYQTLIKDWGNIVKAGK